MNSVHEKRQYKESPEKHANFISIFTFWWMKDIYKLGTKRTLKPEDIYEVKSELTSKGVTEEFIKLWTDEMKRKSPSILRLLFKTFGKRIAFWGLCYSVLDIAMRITHSLCLGGLVDYFSNDTMSVDEGLMYAAGLFISLSVSAVSCHPYMIFMNNIATHIKIGFTGLIYRKALRLPLSSIYESLNGIVINIMADDVNQFNLTLGYLHNAWKGPSETVIFGYFVYKEIGAPGMVGFSLLLCFLPLHAYLAKKSSHFQHKLSRQTDIRIRIMSETIIGIRVIKMYRLEHVFENEIKKVRGLNGIIGIIQSLYRIRAALVSLSLLTRLSIFVTLVTYLEWNHDISNRSMFITFALFNLLNWSMLWQWPFALIHYGQGYIALRRIQAFLLTSETSALPDVNDDEAPLSRTIHPKHETKAITLTDVTSKWVAGSNRSSGIYNCSVNVASAELCAIIGPVGSGKSSLLHVMTGELNIKTGYCEIYGKKSYASQVPWIFEGTVRENIVFTEKFDDGKFRKVVSVCCLEKDISRMPHEDLTLVGECGFSLSGGQSARINLARAVYRDADIYIFDDVLASLDFKIGKYIMQHCIQDYLAGRCCILVTNELQYFKVAEHIVVMVDGRVETEGTFDAVRERGQLPSGLLPFLKNAKTGDVNTSDNVKRKTTSKSLVSVLTILDDDNYYARRIEKHFEGSRIDVYKFYLSSLQSYHFLILIAFLLIASQSLLTGVDYHISNWNVGTNWEIMVSTSKIKTFDLTAKKVDGISDEENRSDQSHYIRTYWGLMAAGTIAFLYRTYTFFGFCLSTSIALHDKLFASVMRAKISFFDLNPSGRILNRFSKDLINIDSQLAQALIEFVTFTLELLSSIIMVSIIINCWMLIPSIAIAIVFCLLRYVYTRTSQSVQRIEAISISDHFGIAMLHCINLIGMCQWGTHDASEIEYEMTSVERIIEYTQLPSEPPLKSDSEKKPPNNWPLCGQIIYRNVYFKYTNSRAMVLSDVNFEINPGEKIGIIGRTGAGKTSIIEALFRMEEYDGEILIDGILTTSLGLHDLRRNISIISQNPILFSSTLRFNLDPFREVTDSQIWDALDQVEMKEFIQTLPCGLDFKLVKGGLNFSMGQRQLICLARAIILNNKILISDEATASVDPETDKLIQQTIKLNFAHCTVLTISHQLHNIMDSDRILVMEYGRVVEFHEPLVLLMKTNGHLRNIVDQNDPVTIKLLTDLAKKVNVLEK